MEDKSIFMSEIDFLVEQWWTFVHYMIDFRILSSNDTNSGLNVFLGSDEDVTFHFNALLMKSDMMMIYLCDLVCI